MLAPPARRTISRTVAARNPVSAKTCPAASRRRCRVWDAGTVAVWVMQPRFKLVFNTSVLNTSFNRTQEKSPRGGGRSGALREELAGLGLVAVDEFGGAHPALVLGLQLEDRQVAVRAGHLERLLVHRQDRAGAMVRLLGIPRPLHLVDHHPLLSAEEGERARVRDQRPNEVLDLRGRLPPVDPAVVLLELLRVARLPLVLRDLDLPPLADLRDHVDQEFGADLRELLLHLRRRRL